MADPNFCIFYGVQLENKGEGPVVERFRNERNKVADSSKDWNPRHFRSSKTEKAVRMNQTPSDFMDDEDVGIFGIAPQNVQIKEYFGPKLGFTRRQIFHPDQEDINFRLMQDEHFNLIVKNLLEQAGWNGSEEPSEMPERTKKPSKQHGISSSLSKGVILSKISIRNRPYGLGHEGLQPENRVNEQYKVTSRFETANMRAKNNSVVPRHAFVMGSLEDDDDVYDYDDTNKYDFGPDSPPPPNERQNFGTNISFTKCVSKACLPNKNYAVLVPPHFKPRKTRFEAVVDNSNQRHQPKKFSFDVKDDASICMNYEGGKGGKSEGDSLSLKRNLTSLIDSEPKKRKKTAEVAQTSYLNKTLKVMDDRFISELDLTTAGNEKKCQSVGKAMSNRLREQWSPCEGLCKRFKVPHNSLKAKSEVKATTSNFLRDVSAREKQKQSFIWHETTKDKFSDACNIPSANFLHGKRDTGKSRSSDFFKELTQEKITVGNDELYTKQKNFNFKENDLFGKVFGESKNDGKSRKDKN